MSKQILLSMDKEDIKKLDNIKKNLGLRFRNVTISFLINRYLAVSKKIEMSSKIEFIRNKKK